MDGPSFSQCDMPNSPPSEFELPPHREFAVKCSVELPSDDKAVKPSIGVGWCAVIAADAPLLADELLCLVLCPLPDKDVVELR